jgi:hypothetical protein
MLPPRRRRGGKIMVAEVQMAHDRRELSFFEPAAYRIRVSGRLDSSWSPLLGEMAISCDSVDGMPLATLTGTLLDQTALLGVLSRLNSLSLPLLSVEWLSETQ